MVANFHPPFPIFGMAECPKSPSNFEGVDGGSLNYVLPLLTDSLSEQPDGVVYIKN